MTSIVDMGTISSRGQIAIPSSIRLALGLVEGNKILFLVENETLLMKKIDSKTFTQLSEPFRKTKKKIKEKDVVSSIHKMRRR